MCVYYGRKKILYRAITSNNNNNQERKNSIELVLCSTNKYFHGRFLIILLVLFKGCKNTKKDFVKNINTFIELSIISKVFVDMRFVS